MSVGNSISQTIFQIVGLALAVLLAIIYRKHKEKINGAFVVVLLVAAALVTVYGLVKFVKWAWYN